MTQTILVVDDEELIRAQIRTALERNGYVVLEADDGIRAIEIFFGEKPDLIIMNYSMPRLDGLQALKEIRKYDKITPVIMESMLIDSLKEKYPENLNVFAFIQLPFKQDELLLKVKQGLTASEESKK
jgi:CheY-like chemotaxis protein